MCSPLWDKPPPHQLSINQRFHLSFCFSLYRKRAFDSLLHLFLRLLTQKIVLYKEHCILTIGNWDVIESFVRWN